MLRCWRSTDKLTQLVETKCRESRTFLECLDVDKIELVMSTSFKFIRILHGATAYYLATDKRQSLPPQQENWCSMSPSALFTKAHISFATTQSFHPNHATQISFQIMVCPTSCSAVCLQHSCAKRLALRMPNRCKFRTGKVSILFIVYIWLYD